MTGRIADGRRACCSGEPEAEKLCAWTLVYISMSVPWGPDVVLSVMRMCTLSQPPTRQCAGV